MNRKQFQSIINENVSALKINFEFSPSQNKAIVRGVAFVNKINEDEIYMYSLNGKFQGRAFSAEKTKV